MEILSRARVLVDVPDTEYRAGDVVTVLEQALKNDKGVTGWWIDKADATEPIVVGENQLSPLG